MAKSRKTKMVEGQYSLEDYFALLAEEPNISQAKGEPEEVTLADYISSKPVDDEQQLIPEEPKRIESNLIKRKGKAVVFRPGEEPDVPFGTDERVTANIRALQELEILNASGEYATPEQQKILHAYSGWEGITETTLKKEEMTKVTDRLSACFDEDQIGELLELPKYPYHASEAVMDDVGKILSYIGFKEGNLLITGIGAGNILRGLPKSMLEKSLVNIDATDGVSGQIASYLFPKTEVMDMAKPLFESFYDAAIGVVPTFSDTEGYLTLKRNTIKLPTFACHMGRTLSAIRTGGLYLMLIDARKTDSMESYLTPFNLSTSPLNFVGGLRLNSSAMNNDVVYDILVFQKVADKKKVHTQNLFEIEQIQLPIFGTTKTCYSKISSYFHNNSECIIGNGLLALDSTGRPAIGSLSEKNRSAAVTRALELWGCKKQYSAVAIDSETEDSKSFPADPNVKNFGMTVINGEVYQRVDSRMIRQRLGGIRLERVKGMIAIRDHARKVYELQLAECDDDALEKAQWALSQVYDRFVAEYGHITDGTNRRLIREDADYTLLASLETVDEEDQIHKSDIFSKRTILMRKAITSCDTIPEAVSVCLDQKAYIDIEHIARLCGVGEDEIKSECAGSMFFHNPLATSAEDAWITKDKYLSGNVKEKLKIAEAQSLLDPSFEANVKALKLVQPAIVPAKDIKVSLGVPFIPIEMIQQFMFEVIGDGRIGTGPDDYIITRDKGARWHIKCKADISPSEPKIYSEFGTPGYSAIRLVKNLLNLSEIAVYEKVYDPASGTDKMVKNPEQTIIVVEKANAIEAAFKNWVLDGGTQEMKVVHAFNEIMNTNVIPRYDGSHLTFPGMTDSVKLGEHQKNAVYRILCNNGDLIAHVVGGGKTFTLLAAGMELKRIGRISKPMYLVPNNLLAQWGGEAMRLYPTAKVLLAEPDDMRKKRRSRFLARMATGDYDMIIMGSSSFINIPPPFQTVQSSMDWLADEVGKVKDQYKGPSEQQKRDRITFFNRCQTEDYDLESIGVDFMFVDESHDYKNLPAQTKHTDLRGVSNTNNVAKCVDMYYKTKYFNGLHKGKGGFVFATGTAITNSIVEMYSLLRYFYEPGLIERGITSLDEWLALFGNVVVDWELPPEGLAEDGSGFRQVSRVASFANIPELMGMVLQFMDVVTREEIHMETPTPIRKTISCLQSHDQKAYMKELVSRANAIRNRRVDPKQDNMLCVTVDGRKSALDIRIIDDTARNHKHSKISECAQQIATIYNQFSPIRGTQLVFCDMGVPGGNGFNVYGDLRETLKKLKIPDDEIAFAHDFKTPSQRVSMRLKMQTGKIRILIGSTETMGQGVNVQNRLIALHNLDVAWTPKDFEQREGRILRPGNMNSQAYILTYVTEGSFDAYMYQLVEMKAKLISQIMRGDFSGRVIEDTDTKVLSYAEIKAIATGDTRFLERAKTEGTLNRLETLRRDYEHRTASLRESVAHRIPESISHLEIMIERIGKDIETIEGCSDNILTVGKESFNVDDNDQRKDAIAALSEAKKYANSGDCVGVYKGLSVVLRAGNIYSSSLFQGNSINSVVLQGMAAHSLDSSSIGSGASILNSCENTIKAIPASLTHRKERLVSEQNALVAAQDLLKEGFEYEDEIQRLRDTLERLTAEISAA
jgi:N12 class adenine-specific DNA methylase